MGEEGPACPRDHRCATYFGDARSQRRLRTLRPTQTTEGELTRKENENAEPKSSHSRSAAMHPELYGQLRRMHGNSDALSRSWRPALFSEAYRPVTGLRADLPDERRLHVALDGTGGP